MLMSVYSVYYVRVYILRILIDVIPDTRRYIIKIYHHLTKKISVDS